MTRRFLGPAYGPGSGGKTAAMKRRSTITIILLIAGVPAILWAQGQSARSETRRALTILYTTNNNGYLDPCG